MRGLISRLTLVPVLLAAGCGGGGEEAVDGKIARPEIGWFEVNEDELATGEHDRLQRAVTRRGAFDDALTWLEIQGGDAETLARWRSIAAAGDGPASAATTRRRRRPRRRRPRRADPERS